MHVCIYISDKGIIGCCNLLNYVYILVKEKKQKEIRNKHTHTTRLH
jgi:hypothetical protein